MGILESSKQQKPTPSSAKRSSTQLDFSNLNPLKSGGTVGFSAFRDSDPAASRKSKARKKSNGSIGGAMAEDSEEDDDENELLGKMDDIDDKEIDKMLSPEEAKFQGELAEGVGRIKLKRQHSAEPLGSMSRKSPSTTGTPAFSATPPDIVSSSTDTPALDIKGDTANHSLLDESFVGSPLKRHRASIYDNADDSIIPPNDNLLAPMANILDKAEAGQTPALPLAAAGINEEEEL